MQKVGLPVQDIFGFHIVKVTFLGHDNHDSSTSTVSWLL